MAAIVARVAPYFRRRGMDVVRGLQVGWFVLFLNREARGGRDF